MKAVLLLLAVVAVASAWNAYADSDEVTSLPGLAQMPSFKMYAGYLNVDADHNRNLFYFFTEAASSPDTAPLLLWMNGGPGCSSLDGFLYEHGPLAFADESGKTLKLRETSWNQFANVLYIEAPAGVGFSYSDDKSDYNVGDHQYAKDLYAALGAFLTEHPSMAGHDFYISAESYGGIYAPIVTEAVFDGSLDIKLRGWISGNGLLDWATDAAAYHSFNYDHIQINQEVFDAVEAACSDYFNPSPACEAQLDAMNEIVRDVNFYGIYNDCFHAPSESVDAAAGRRTSISLPEPLAENPLAKAQLHRLKSGLRGVDPPCIDTEAAKVWLNTPEVRAAIHAKADAPAWWVCSDAITYNMEYVSVLPIYQKLLPHLRALVYSGDTDMAVSHVGTQTALLKLGLSETKKWAPVMFGKQVLGMQQQWGSLTFTTVRGAGHMVPQDKPAQAFQLIQQWITESGDFA